jgi:transposase-like protein
MQTKQEILESIKQLGDDEIRQIANNLLSYLDSDKKHHVKVQVELSSRGIKKPCPYCSSANVYRKGKQKGIQNYICNDCNRCYSEHYGTPLWDIKKKDKFEKYICLMQQGLTLREIAKELQISLQTSFDWRHKILGSLQGLTPSKLGPVVECDEMELRLNNKGERNLKRPARKRSGDFKRNAQTEDITTVQVLCAIDRQGNRYLKAIESKRLTEEQISLALDGKLMDNSVLITDEHKSFKAFARKNPHFNHKMIKSIRYLHRDDRNINLQKVNNLHKQIRDFLQPFGSVSAKYLQNYLNWFAYQNKLNQNVNRIYNWVMNIATADFAYQLFWMFKQNAINIRT